MEHKQEAKDTTEESLRSWEVEEALRHIGPHHRHAIVETYYRDRPCAEVAAECVVGGPQSCFAVERRCVLQPSYAA